MGNKIDKKYIIKNKTKLSTLTNFNIKNNNYRNLTNNN